MSDKLHRIIQRIENTKANRQEVAAYLREHGNMTSPRLMELLADLIERKRHFGSGRMPEPNDWVKEFLIETDLAEQQANLKGKGTDSYGAAVDKVAEKHGIKPGRVDQIRYPRKTKSRKRKIEKAPTDDS